MTQEKPASHQFLKDIPQIFADECESIEQCPSLQRIVQYLKIHQSADPQEICQVLNTENTPFLTDDFHHILFHHLSDQKPVEETRNEYELIYNYVMTKVPQCKLSKCENYRRNNRQRETQKILTKIDTTTAYYVEMMDRMHCFFIHSFDVGFRLKSKELKDVFNEDDNKSEQDLSMIRLTKSLNSRRQALESARGAQAVQNTKFVSEITVDRDTEMKANDELVNEYSMGMRYCYEGFEGWDNATLVKKKYASLKDEIMNNKECTIPMDEYEEAMNRAIQFLSARRAKLIVSDKWQWLCEYYDIKENSTITEAHILSVLLYTDFSTLSYHFSSTFRKKNASQTVEMCAQRNAEYAIWSKLLSQTVNIFGQSIQDTKIEIYYHGISQLLIFSTFLSFYNAPTSTTTQCTVAAIFSGDKGAILQLKNGGYALKCFNCSWISTFANEDERLFMIPHDGYDRKLRITSITSLSRKENYRYYVHAITSLSYAINAQDISKFAHNFTNRDRQILKRLIKDAQNNPTNDEVAKYQSAVYGNEQLLLRKQQQVNDDHKSEFPKYVVKVFGEFVKTVKKVKVNVNYLHALQSIFVLQNGFFNIAGAVKMFVNCEVLEVWYNSDNDQHLKSDYFAHITSELNAVSDTKLVHMDFNRIKYDAKLLDEYKVELNEMNWNPKAVHESKCAFSKS
eukprot:89669_1